jgi:hypothetical protein
MRSERQLYVISIAKAVNPLIARTAHSALRPSRPFTGLDGIPESRRLFGVGLRRLRLEAPALNL